MAMTKSEAGKLGSIKGQITQQKQKEARIKEYNENPKLCKCCRKPLVYEKRRNTFCSQSCAASFNNKGIRRNYKEDKDYEDHKCANCGSIISYKKKYCSIKCQNNYQYKQEVKNWKDGKIGGVKGKTGTSNYIKHYMLEKSKHKCEQCGWAEVNPFNGKSPLELHHKDGDYTNNKEDNLQILCPNCHSLTRNYKNTGSRKSKRNR